MRLAILLHDIGWYAFLSDLSLFVPPVQLVFQDRLCQLPQFLVVEKLIRVQVKCHIMCKNHLKMWIYGLDMMITLRISAK